MIYWVRVSDSRMPRDGMSSHHDLISALERAGEEISANHDVKVTISTASLAPNPTKSANRYAGEEPFEGPSWSELFPRKDESRDA